MKREVGLGLKSNRKYIIRKRGPGKSRLGRGIEYIQCFDIAFLWRSTGGSMLDRH